MLNPGNHERLAAKSEESRIGIYASKAAIPPIIAQLHEVAGAVTSAKLSTEYVKKENLTQPILDTLASITNTIIEKSSSGKVSRHMDKISTMCVYANIDPGIDGSLDCRQR